jgi:hypothetical protein
MTNITENIHNSYSAKLAVVYFASSIALSSLSDIAQAIPSNPIINIQHTLVQSSYTTSLSGLIEQELKEIVNKMIAQQIPSDHELDMVITNNLWNIYDHGFPE